jgi:uncharacterized OB-fold protein
VTAGVRVSACVTCGWTGLPERYWCPRCGSDRVEEAIAHTGRVEEATTLERAVGHASLSIPIGSVRLPAGGAIVARLEHGAVAGLDVELVEDGGAAVARPHPAPGEAPDA